MTEIKPIIPHYETDEEPVVRRLGAAVIAQWKDLPADVQKRLVEQATFVEDPKNPTVQLQQQINVLIRKHNPNWDGQDD